MNPDPLYNTINSYIDTYDVLGCGFGPANLGIAVALADKWSIDKKTQRVIFIEKHPDFRWHPGMLIPGARMQISCLKDLATLRNPCSPFTFLSYLHAQNRLSVFINRGSTIPSRREFSDYLAWAAREVTRRGVEVAYAEEVIAISKVHVGEEERIEVTSRRSTSGELIVRRTKDIILSAGGSPRIPRVLSSLQQQKWTEESVLEVPVLHTASYITFIRPVLSRLSQLGRPLKIAIVGGGQSAAECLMDAYNRLESLLPGGHQVDMVIRKGSLKPSDDSPFVNEIFDPSSTDEWYNLSTDRLRGQILSEYKNTNYSVVNPKSLDNLYELIYEQRLSESIASRDCSGASDMNVRINLRHNENVVGATIASLGVDHSPRQITLVRQNTRTHELVEDVYDAIICGTGYERTAWMNFLRRSNLAKDYGLAGITDDTPVKLVPAHCTFAPEAESEFSSFDSRHTSQHEQDPIQSPVTGSTSSSSTPPSSPSLSCSSQSLSTPVQIRISRAYRLLPVSSVQGKRGRIYVQGCAEATHGLSDTLLSVIGVRSGEVVDDLLAEEKEN